MKISPYRSIGQFIRLSSSKLSSIDRSGQVTGTTPTGPSVDGESSGNRSGNTGKESGTDGAASRGQNSTDSSSQNGSRNRPGLPNGRRPPVGRSQSTTISPRSNSGGNPRTTKPPATKIPDSYVDAADKSNSSDSTSKASGDDKGPNDLSPAERRKVQKLKRIDAKVRAHEQAHLAAAGPYAQGGPQYQYVQGPDGKRYAVGGSVSLDTSQADTPQETIKKMRTVRQAALAPANPSSQDMSIANEATQKLNQARQKKRKKERKQQKAENGGSSQNQPARPRNNSSDPTSPNGQSGDPRSTRKSGRGSNGNSGGFVIENNGTTYERAPGRQASGDGEKEGSESNSTEFFNDFGDEPGFAGQIESNPRDNRSDGDPAANTEREDSTRVTENDPTAGRGSETRSNDADRPGNNDRGTEPFNAAQASRSDRRPGRVFDLVV